MTPAVRQIRKQTQHRQDLQYEGRRFRDGNGHAAALPGTAWENDELFNWASDSLSEVIAVTLPWSELCLCVHAQNATQC